MPNDKTTNIQELKDLIAKFRDDRDWLQFHDPKNLAEAIAIEAAELQECFLWKNREEVAERMENDSEYRKEIEEELADVIINAINFANAAGIDIAGAIRGKVAKNNKNYPIAKSHGKATKHTKL